MTHERCNLLHTWRMRRIAIQLSQKYFIIQQTLKFQTNLTF